MTQLRGALIAAWLLVLGAEAASPPDLINYQGILRNAGGGPLSGEFDMVFRFYDAAIGGDELLVDEHLASGTGSVTVSGGVFNVHLGGGDVLDGSGPGVFSSLTAVFQGFTGVYLEVQVAAETLTPRTRFVSAPYALSSAAAASSTCDGTIAFADDFNRPDSTTVSNGWNEDEAAQAAARILDERLDFPSGQAAIVYRGHEGGAAGNNTTVTWVYRTTLNAAVSDGVSLRQSCTSCRAIDGLNVQFNVESHLIEIRDGPTLKAGLSTFPFQINTDYSFQWDVYSDNSMNLWAWRSGTPRPIAPTLTVVPFSPTSTGSRWAIGMRGGSSFDDFRVLSPACPQP